MSFLRVAIAVVFVGAYANAQSPTDPFPTPINATDGVIKVNFVEFATLPDLGGPMPARPMLLRRRARHAPAVRQRHARAAVRDSATTARRLRCTSTSTTRSGASRCNSQGNERGFQSFAFHPQFNRQGTPGFGKFYTYTDTANMPPAADFKPRRRPHTHDTVLLEWTAKNPAAATYDGGAPRELMRFEQPFANHNGGQLALQSARRAEQRRFRSALHGLRRRRQRRRSAQQRAEPQLGVRQDPAASIRSARTARTGSTAFPRQSVRQRNDPTRSARSTPSACAIRSASRGTRRTATCSSPTSARTSSKR